MATVARLQLLLLLLLAALGISVTAPAPTPLPMPSSSPDLNLSAAGAAAISAAEKAGAILRMDRDADGKLSHAEVKQYWQREHERGRAMSTSEEVADWVSFAVGLPQHAAAFRENAVTARDLPSLLSDEKLLRDDLGVAKALHRKRLANAIEARIWGIGSSPAAPEEVSCESQAPGKVTVRWDRECEGMACADDSALYRVLRYASADKRWVAVGHGAVQAWTAEQAVAVGPQTYAVEAWNDFGRSNRTLVRKCRAEGQDGQRAAVSFLGTIDSSAGSESGKMGTLDPGELLAYDTGAAGATAIGVAGGISGMVATMDRSGDGELDVVEMKRFWDSMTAEGPQRLDTKEKTADWLAFALGKPEYTETFLDNAVTGYSFPELVKQPMLGKELGIPAIAAAEIMTAIKERLVGETHNIKPPVSPKAVGCFSRQAGNMTVQWKHNNSVPNLYRIERCSQDCSPESLTWRTVGNTSMDRFRDTGLDEVRAYRYRVEAWNRVGRSLAREPDSACRPDGGSSSPGDWSQDSLRHHLMEIDTDGDHRIGSDELYRALDSESGKGHMQTARRSMDTDGNGEISTEEFARASARSAVTSEIDVVNWLVRAVGLPQYVAAFKTNTVLGMDLPNLLSDSVLTHDMGIEGALHRAKIKQSIRLLLYNPITPLLSPDTLTCSSVLAGEIQLRWQVPASIGQFIGGAGIFAQRLNTSEDGAEWVDVVHTERIGAGQLGKSAKVAVDAGLPKKDAQFSYRVQVWTVQGQSEVQELHGCVADGARVVMHASDSDSSGRSKPSPRPDAAEGGWYLDPVEFVMVILTIVASYWYMEVMFGRKKQQAQHDKVKMADKEKAKGEKKRQDLAKTESSPRNPANRLVSSPRGLGAVALGRFSDVGRSATAPAVLNSQEDTFEPSPQTAEQVRARTNWSSVRAGHVPNLHSQRGMAAVVRQAGVAQLGWQAEPAVPAARGGGGGPRRPRAQSAGGGEAVRLSSSTSAPPHADADSPRGDGAPDDLFGKEDSKENELLKSRKAKTGSGRRFGFGKKK